MEGGGRRQPTTSALLLTDAHSVRRRHASRSHAWRPRRRPMLPALVLQTGQTTITAIGSASPSESTLRHPLAKRWVSPPHVWHITRVGKPPVGGSTACSVTIIGEIWSRWTRLSLLLDCICPEYEPPRKGLVRTREAGIVLRFGQPDPAVPDHAPNVAE